MAIQDQTGPVGVTVFCDKCGTEVFHDYMVPAGQDSLTVARNYLATKEGWQIQPGVDLCGGCKTNPAPSGTK